MALINDILANTIECNVNSTTIVRLYYEYYLIHDVTATIHSVLGSQGGRWTAVVNCTQVTLGYMYWNKYTFN